MRLICILLMITLCLTACIYNKDSMQTPVVAEQSDIIPSEPEPYVLDEKYMIDKIKHLFVSMHEQFNSLLTEYYLDTPSPIVIGEYDKGCICLTLPQERHVYFSEFYKYMERFFCDEVTLLAVLRINSFDIIKDYIVIPSVLDDYPQIDYENVQVKIISNDFNAIIADITAYNTSGDEFFFRYKIDCGDPNNYRLKSFVNAEEFLLQKDISVLDSISYDEWKISRNVHAPFRITTAELFNLYEDENYWYYNNAIGAFMQGKKDYTNIYLGDFQIIAVSLDWVYYIEYNDDETLYKLFRMNIYDKSRQCFFSGSVFSESDGTSIPDELFINDKHLIVHFSNYDLIHFRTDLLQDGVNEYLMLDSTSRSGEKIYLSNDKVYFIEWASLSVIDLNTMTKDIILSGYDYTTGTKENLIINFALLENELYIFQKEPTGYYKFVNGEQILILEQSDCKHEFNHEIFVYDGYIYFIDNHEDSDNVVIQKFDPVNELFTKVVELQSIIKRKIICGQYCYSDTTGLYHTIMLK